MGICPSLEIATKNQNYLESLTSAAQFRLIDLFLAMTVYLPVWHSHCTRARFTVVMSYSGELVVHSCQFLCLQGDVRVARLVFLGQISEFWPGFKVVDLKNFIWPFGLISSWLALRNSFWPFGYFLAFSPEKISSEGKYYYSIFFGNTFVNVFDKCYSRPTRHVRSDNRCSQVISCFEGRYPKQNSIIRLKSNIFPPQFLSWLRYWFWCW